MAATAEGAASLDIVHRHCSRTAPCPRVVQRSTNEPATGNKRSSLKSIKFQLGKKKNFLSVKFMANNEQS